MRRKRQSGLKTQKEQALDPLENFRRKEEVKEEPQGRFIGRVKMKTMPTYAELEEQGIKLGSEMEGTVLIYEYDNEEYAVLQDNTVISKKEWDR